MHVIKYLGVMLAITTLGDSSLCALADDNLAGNTKISGVRVVPKDKPISKNQARIIRPSFISDVRVVPSAQNVVISFGSTERSAALVEFAKVAPVQDAKDVYGFTGGGLFSRFVTPQNGTATLNLNAVNQELEVGALYYYIINVFNDNKKDVKRPREQTSGRFTTLGQSVKVFWDRVHVLNDSDPNGSGELKFWFHANYGDPTERSWLPTKWNDLSDGQWHNLKMPLFISSAPDKLTLHASGEDHDTVSAPYFPSTAPPRTGAGMTGDYEWNVAKAEFDLSQLPGDSVNIPFTLRSMPNGGKLGDLKFEVTGTITIIRYATLPPDNEPQMPTPPQPARKKPSLKDQIRDRIKFPG